MAPDDAEPPSEAAPFRVSLANFDGPFDLLLTLIAKRDLDITEVALSAVTDEFLAYFAELGGFGMQATAKELDAASEFIVVAATLLDMKIVALLPRGDYVDAEDVAAFEARDLLFARLLQYRAFREASQWFRERMADEATRHEREARIPQRLLDRVPPLKWTLSLDDFAALATAALTPREAPAVRLDHLHAPLVSIRAEATRLISRLRQTERPLAFADLVADATEPGIVVARFLALLELYRRAAVNFEWPPASDGQLGVFSVRLDADRDGLGPLPDDELATLGADLEPVDAPERIPAK